MISVTGGSFLGSAQPFAQNTTGPKMLVRISTAKGPVDLSSDVEVVSEYSAEWVDVILTHSQLNEVARTQKEYTILLDDVEQYSKSVAGSYHSLAEMEQILHNLSVTYPAITQLKSIGTTYEGRSIWCLEISDNPGFDEGEPGVYFMGVHHAREWPTLEICLFIAQKLCSEYGSNATITNLINARRIWITPCVNPDGYYYCHDQGHDWRKNRHYFPEFSTYGVDLNRNYAGSSNGDIRGAWGSVGNGGASHTPNSEVYCGPGAFSENETQAIRNMFLHYNISASITWHNYGEVVIPPWGYASIPNPDNSYMKNVTQQIAKRMTKDSGSGTYTPSYSGGISGDMTDWAYGYDHYEQGKATFAFTIESCSEFQPPAEKLDQVVSENFKGALYLLEEATNISMVAPRVLPPRIHEMTWDKDGDYNVSWDEQNPAAGADTFQLDELSGLSLRMDDAETNTGKWVLNGFSVNTTQSHSGEHSYMSRNKSRDVSSMTSGYPTPIIEGRNLSFWCWYTIESNKDYAMVEVSRDGRSYDILGTFTGSSGNWTYKTYPLDNYVGDSIFIRFRYTTDNMKTLAGFYVDDIAPVTHFSHVTTLSDFIFTTSYHIQGKSNGTYLYRVRGHNTARDWGDFSMLQKIKVGNTPLKIEIIAPEQHALYMKNRRILPFFTTVIFGAITVEANVSDSSEINRVEFSLDGTVQFTAYYFPSSWYWSKKSFFRHTITVIAYNTSGASVSDERTVWKFF